MKKSLICIIAFLFLFCISAWAESMDKYYEVETSYPDYDTTQTSGFIYSDSMLLGGATPMSGDLCKASAVISAAVYDSDRIQSVMEDMDYSVQRMTGYGTHTIDDCDHVAYTVGKKEIEGGKVLYCIAIRGTGKNSEWFSDFNLGDPGTNGGEHLGFKLAADEVFWDLNKIFNDDGCNSSNRYLWFMGHSRGAAVANILAARYTKTHFYASADHIFGYTFACPAVTKNPESYSNIFNFNNKGDVIPTFPLKDWDYGRHGQDYDYAFTGDVEFEASFYREVKRENSATFDTYAYEQIVKNLVPEEEDITDPVRHFGLMVLAWCLGGKTEVGLDEVLAKYADDVFTEEYLKAQVLNVTGLDGLYSLLSGGESDTTEEIAFIEKAIAETREMDSEEFHQWTLDNYDMIVKIAKTTGQTISTYADLDPVLGTITRLAPTFWDVGECIGCIMDIVHSSNGNALYSIIDGHRQGTYVRGWNARYLGYKAYEGVEVSSITVPSNVTTIGQRAFVGSGITTVSGMDHVKAVGKEAFYECEDFTTDTIAEAMHYVGIRGFNNCTGIRLELGTQLIWVEDYAFANSGIRESLEFSCVKHIGASAFSGCSSLSKVVLNRNLEELGKNAFNGCSGLKEVTIPIELSGDNFFQCSAVETIHYLKGSTGIMMDRTFDISSSEEEGKVTRFYSLEWNAGRSLRTVDFEEGIVRIGAYAFMDGDGLEKCMIPNTVQSIGEKAFQNRITLSIYGYLNSYAQTYAYENGIQFICLDVEKLSSDFVLPSSLTMIGEEAFTGCVFTAVKVPTGCESIGALAFSNCKNLVQIEIPESVTEIAEDAFKDSDSVIIFCQAGSAAETFAKKHGVVYVIE